MSSPAAVVGLMFRGVDIQDLDGLYLEIILGLDGIPEVRGEDSVVPALVGRVPRNRIADRLAIELDGFVRGVGSSETTDREDYRANVASMQALFDPELDPGLLEATLEDGTVATIHARTLTMLEESIVPTYKHVNFELESVDPRWSVGS